MIRALCLAFLLLRAALAAEFTIPELFAVMEKRFSMVLVYSDEVTLNEFGDPIHLTIDQEKYDLEHLLLALRNTLGLSIVPMADKTRHYMVRPLKMMMLDRLAQLDDRLSALEQGLAEERAWERVTSAALEQLRIALENLERRLITLVNNR
jgi:hypothetical protein